jgi:O-antigen ligase
MRRVAWGLLLTFVFTIPWEYSLNLGQPLGHVARIAGILALLAAILAVLQQGRVRTVGPIQWLALAFFLWICASYFWSIAPDVTLEKMRGFFQELMIVWLIWELAESPEDVRSLMRAYVAGAWVLALLTLGSLVSGGSEVDQIRFVAEGQDANDMARYLDLGLPMAALLLTCERGRFARVLAAGYLPLGVLAVLVTASREGFVAALIALSGCGVLLYSRYRRAVVGAIALLPAIVFGLSLIVPHGTFERLATIPEELNRGDLNQRWNIWHAGWQAFVHAPLVGTGAGSFVSAAGLNPVDTAHDTALSILADGGLIALFLAATIVALTARAVVQMRGPLQLALTTTLLGWITTSLVATVEENRSTWLLIGLIAIAGKMAAEDPRAAALCFGENGEPVKVQARARDANPAAGLNPIEAGETSCR